MTDNQGEMEQGDQEEFESLEGSDGPAFESVDEDDGLSIDDWMAGFSEESPDYSLDELSQAYAQILADQEDGASSESAETESDGEAEPDAGEEASESEKDAEEEAIDEQAVQSEAIAFLEPVELIDRNVDLQQDDRITLTPERIVESILFVGTSDNSAVSGRLIASLIRGVSPKEVDQYVEKLNEGYRADQCPYRIQKEALGYRMVLREAFQSIRSRFYGQIREVKLSQVVVDALAIVAFHQPVDRGRVEQLMGRPCGSYLNQLLRRNLLTLEVKSKTEKLYRTTDRFLDLFGMESLDDLPQMDSEEG